MVVGAVLPPSPQPDRAIAANDPSSQANYSAAATLSQGTTTLYTDRRLENEDWRQQ